MDMPNGCCDCDLCIYVSEKQDCICRATMEDEYTYKTIDFDVAYNYNDRATWCPLRYCPQKKDTKYNPARNPYITQGYNACIDEIGGGE